MTYTKFLKEALSPVRKWTTTKSTWVHYGVDRKYEIYSTKNMFGKTVYRVTEKDTNGNELATVGPPQGYPTPEVAMSSINNLLDNVK